MKKCLVFLCIVFLFLPSSTNAALSFGSNALNQTLYPSYASALPEKKSLILDIAKLKAQIESEYVNGKIVIQGLNSIIEKAGKSKNILNGLIFKYQLKKLRAKEESEKLFYSYTLKKLQLGLVILEELEDISQYPEIEKHIIILQKHLTELVSQSIVPSFEQYEQKGDFTFSFNLDSKNYGKLDFELGAKNIKVLKNKEDYDISLDFSLALKGENLEALGMENIDMQLQAFFDSVLKNKDAYLLIKNLQTSGGEKLPYMKDIIDGLKKIASVNRFIKIKKTSSSTPTPNTYISSYTLQASKIDKKKVEEFSKTSLFNVMEKNGDTYTLVLKNASCKAYKLCKTSTNTTKITLSGVESEKYLLRVTDTKMPTNNLEVSYTPSEIEKMSLAISEKKSSGITKLSFLWDKGNISADFSTDANQASSFSFKASGLLKKDVVDIKSTFSFDDPLKGYSQDARSAKTASDMFSYMSVMNVKITEGISSKDLIIVNPQYKVYDIWVGGEKLVLGENYFIGTPNYKILGLKEDDFKMPDGSEYIIAATTKSGGKYEILGHIENKLQRIAFIKGDYSPRKKEEIQVTSTGGYIVEIESTYNIGKLKLGDVTNLGKIKDVSPNGLKLTLTEKVPSGKNTIYLSHQDTESLIISENGEIIKEGDILKNLITNSVPEEKVQGHFNISSSKNGIYQEGTVDFSISHSKYGSLLMNSDSTMSLEGKSVEVKAPAEYKEMDISELNPYEAQLKKARDASRLNDIISLRGAVEQVYQDTNQYPTKEDFTKLIKKYIYYIPKDSLSGKTINGCTFGYSYEVGEDVNGIKNGAYILSTCFEISENIENKAKKDDGKDPLRYEVGILKFGKGVTQKFFIDSLK